MHSKCDSYVSADVTLLESRIGTACRTFSVEDFGVLLELLYEGLPLGSGLSAHDIASLIRFSAIVLHDAPESEFLHTLLHTFVVPQQRYQAHPKYASPSQPGA